MTWLFAIASLFTTFVSSAVFFSSFVLFRPMHFEFGWSLITLAITLLVPLVLAGLLFLLVRRLYNRLGTRLVISIGILLLGVGCMFISQISSIWQLLLSWGVVIGAGLGSSLVLVVYILKIWLPNKIWLVIFAVVFGLGVLTVPLINNQLIPTYGWRTTYLTIGIVALKVLFLSTILFIVAYIWHFFRIKNRA